MFPAGVYFLLVALLNVHTGKTEQFIIDNDMNFYQCNNMQMYFQDFPMRQFDKGDSKYITQTSCIKKGEG